MPSTRATEMLRDLKRAGLKMTPQRVAIVELFANDESHPTAQDLFERLRPSFPSMSFATVYNTLDALARAGLSGTLRLGNAARFDPNTSAHHHAVCDRCGAIVDVPAETMTPKASTVRKLQKTAGGFSVRAVERVYRGLCAACSSRGIATSSSISSQARVPQVRFLESGVLDSGRVKSGSGQAPKLALKRTPAKSPST